MVKGVTPRALEQRGTAPEHVAVQEVSGARLAWLLAIGRRRSSLLLYLLRSLVNLNPI